MTLANFATKKNPFCMFHTRITILLLLLGNKSGKKLPLENLK
jgi:hypothetical protein